MTRRLSEKYSQPPVRTRTVSTSSHDRFQRSVSQFETTTRSSSDSYSSSSDVLLPASSYRIIRWRRSPQFLTALPMKANVSEFIRSYRDSRDFQPDTLSLLSSSSVHKFPDIPYRPLTRASINRGSVLKRSTVWSRASTASRFQQ